MPDHDISPLMVFISAFGLAASAGLAAMLKFSRHVTLVGVLSSMLYSGLSGLMIALFWYNRFRSDDNIYALLAGCIAAGLTGAKISDVVMRFVANKFNVNITLVAEDKPDEKPDELPPPPAEGSGK